MPSGGFLVIVEGDQPPSAAVHRRRGSSLRLPSLSPIPSSSSPPSAEPPYPPSQETRHVRKGRRLSRAPGRRGGACAGCRSCRRCPRTPGFSRPTDGLGLAPRRRPSPPPLPGDSRVGAPPPASLALLVSTHLLVLNFAFLAPKGACGGRRARVGKAPPWVAERRVGNCGKMLT